jgi:hypothetical protein
MSGLTTFRSTWSNPSSVSAAPTSRAVSRKRSNCGFSPGGLGLRAGMEVISKRWSELYRTHFDNGTFFALPCIEAIVVMRTSPQGANLNPSHSPLSTRCARIRWLLCKLLFKGRHSRFQCSYTISHCCPALGEVNGFLSLTRRPHDQRPFREDRYG